MRASEIFNHTAVRNAKRAFINCCINVTAQNLVENVKETPLQPSIINKDFPEDAFLPPNFEQLRINIIGGQKVFAISNDTITCAGNVNRLRSEVIRFYQS
ncbi:hypothetical protein [Endozoicomonas ascidiicola]|uniref:hypothetical protein n=1 Tax=Endozoicomonas ascidiicola TaxID=1698521 RepID=UPI0008350C0F|nr:hypothetical protein [Endozoicomonas ascidiicola]